MNIRICVTGKKQIPEDTISGLIKLTPDGKSEREFHFNITDPFGENLFLQITNGGKTLVEIRGNPTVEKLRAMPMKEQALLSVVIDPLSLVCETIESQYGVDPGVKERYDEAAMLMELGVVGGSLALVAKQVFTDQSFGYRLNLPCR